jgi:hypothetical protein
MSAIESRRTAALVAFSPRALSRGGHVERCEACAHIRIAYNSCRNRHCPKCQAAAAREWLADPEAELLPVPYYHVVFTLPAGIAEIAYHNKAAIYGILFKTAAETLITIAADPRHLGVDLDGLSGLRIASLACRPRRHIEDAKSEDADRIPRHEGIENGVHHGRNRPARSSLV